MLEATASDADMMSMLQAHQTQMQEISDGLAGVVASTGLLRDGLDASWVLLGSYIIFLMSLGFSLLDAGSVKAMNTKNVLYQCAVTTCASILAFWLVGFGLAQGSDPAFGHMKSAATLALPSFPVFLWLWGFANVTGLIVTGSVTSRVSMLAHLTLTLVVSGLLFPVVAYQIWSHGFLSHASGGLQMIDFAGGLPVHVLGGVVALTAALIVGPRHDRFVFNAESGRMDDRKEPGHSVVFTLLGTFLLWFSWFGYNSSSTLGLTDGRYLVASGAAVNTAIAAGVGSLAITGWHMLFTDVHNLWELLNGILCGLVAISPACATVEPWAAFLIGAGSIFAYRGGVRFLEWMRVDDVVESFAVHGCCGAFGILATALLSTQANCDRLYGADNFTLHIGRQLGVHLLGLVTTSLIGVVGSAVPLLLLRRCCSGGVRVTLEERGGGTGRSAPRRIRSHTERRTRRRREEPASNCSHCI